VADAPLFERAVLWVAHPPVLWQKVGGMTVLERQLFTVARAGLKKAVIALHQPEPARLAGLRLPPGLEVRWVEGGQSGALDCAPPYLGVSTDHLVRTETLAFLARQRFPESTTYEDASGLAVVQAVLTGAEAITRLKQPLPEPAYRRLEAPLDADHLTDWLMAAGPKDADGFMARHFDRHISLAVSRALLPTSVTPNQMTPFSTTLGLLGAGLFLGSGPAWHAPGALLVWLHSVLDGCDGELARVRFQESPFGADLDFWGDNLVHLALFSALGAGFWLGGAGILPLALAAVADFGVVASALMAWRHRLAKRAAGATGPEAGVTQERAGDAVASRLSRLENALAQRDFIYLLVILAFLDRTYEFLWAAAIGGLLYFGVMLYLRRENDNDQARQPHPAR
jgi:1L-myo-inositol 1-phosphate cytidylyltransferase / CDP-L-myo-inositol myo-inositolphosphotransferase